MAKTNGKADMTGLASTTAPAGNFTLEYRRDHPKSRCSYGVAGVAGIVVFDLNLIAGSDQPGFTMPSTITIDVPLAEPKADNKAAKAEQAALRAAERAAKAEARVAAAQEKAQERAGKLAAAAAAAQAKLAAAQASQ